MPIFSDLKKLFFGAKSVAKHQGGKAAEAAGKMAEDLRDSGADLIDDTKAAASELAGEIMDKAPDYIEKGKDALEDLSDKIWREADAAVDKAKAMKDEASDAVNSKLEELKPKADPEPVDLDADFGLSLEDLGMTEVSEPAAPKSGSIDFEADLIDDPVGNAKKAAAGLKDAAGDAFNKLKETTAAASKAAAEAADPVLNAAAKAGANLKDKVEDISEAVGKEVLEKGDDLLNRGAAIGADLKDKASDFIDHANTEAEKMKLEESIEEAKRAAEVAEARARAFDGKEAARDTSDSLLSGTDSFFDRASRFADGDYTNEGGKDMQIQDNPDATPKEKGGKIAGFLDSDGDGDSLIDDAEIVE